MSKLKESIRICILLTVVEFLVVNALNPCTDSNCANFSKCVPIDEYEYTCQCNTTSQSVAYWTGKYCDQPTISNPCFSNPCKQNSSCLFDEKFNAYKCICQTGYTGVACDKLIDICQSFPCKNKGFCSNIDMFGVRKANFYRCTCAPGFTGYNCDIQINQCDSSPCLNYGICINTPNQYQCVCLPSYNGTRCENNFSNNKATCDCPPGFYGSNCELVLNQCGNIINPCNTGICMPIAKGSLPYSCICLPGFTGVNCEQSVDLCATKPCKFGGNCTQNTPSDYVCSCPPGTQGKSCEINIDECQSNPCKNNGTCVESSINMYTCVCAEGYVGINCEVLSVKCTSNTCLNGGLCLVTATGPTCICLPGFTGTRCEQSLSGCVSNPCLNNGTCLKELNNTYKCVCQPGYTGINCENTFDLCTLYNPCQNSGNCTTVGSSYSCQCPPNYSGQFCESYYSICETRPCVNGKCYELSPGTYKCFCNRGYTGANCDQVIDTCQPNPCKNNANCTALVNDYVCSCPTGYTSKRCEVEINACDSNPCLNGGICYNSFDFYNCSCSPDFNGTNCQLSLDPCLLNNCSNRGRCINKFDIAICECDVPYYGDVCQFTRDICASRPCQNAGLCTPNLNSYNCTCGAGFTGTNCQTVVDPCTDYCQNGGTCFMDAQLMLGCQCPCNYEGTRCENRLNFCNATANCGNGTCTEIECGYKCECNCGFTGQFCQSKLNACLPDSFGNPRCLNGGTCVDNSCNYTCLCTPGFTGPNCQIPKNSCDPDNCLNGATCVPGTDDYTCTCPCAAYSGKNCDIYQDVCTTRESECLNGGRCISQGCDIKCECTQYFTGTRCEKDADPCTYNTCFNNGTCISSPGSTTFACKCQKPYTGPDCSQLENVISPCVSSPCNVFQVCNQVGLYNYSCTCPPFYTGQRCEIKVRSCLSSPCNGGQCIENTSNGGYNCNCPPGTTGSDCKRFIDICASSPCLNSANCSVIRANVFNCTCPFGYTGRLCEIAIDPCQSYPCLNNGACYKKAPGEYGCNCTSCYSGTRCETMVMVCSNQNCSGNGVCLTMGPCNSKCICNPGYTGQDCQTQINPCISNPCLNGTCVAQGNSWSCNCAPGYTGVRCSNLLLACTSSPCENGGLCINSLTDYGYTCNCLPGWTGTSCEIDFNECNSPMNRCQNNATCIEDKINSYRCLCKSSYTGLFCENQIDLCLSRPCLNSGVCTSNPENGTFTCTCDSGFYGSRCEYQLNECSSSPCLNNGICIDLVNSYECRCPKEYAGPNCNLISCVNYCYNGGTCYSDSNLGSAFCACLPGFTGDRCELIYNPCESNPCVANQGKCVNRYFGYFECFCNIGYTGELCETKIDPCSVNPCIRGFCYSNTSGIAKCFCPDGYTGRYCEIELTLCEPVNPCQNSGKCVLPISYNISTCKPGLTGPDCNTVIDACASSPCLSSAATCVMLDFNLFKCICPPYETGNLCETTINLCLPNPCPTQIQCYQTSFTETKCICPPGFTGPRCTERYDVCSSNPCINGICVSPLPGILRCDCFPEFKGTFCEQSLIVCDSVTCLNGGYCVSNATNSMTQCVCPFGYTGVYCEVPIDPCKLSNPCLNDGVCYYVSPGRSVCKCKSNCFYGDLCQSTVNPCDGNNCKNNGTCIRDDQNCTYTCQCPRGFTGLNCEINLDPCLSIKNPCYNNGTCIGDLVNNNYTCICSSLYSGKFCESFANPCADKHCLNGGVCTIDPVYNQPFCLCQYGYTGLDCSNLIDFCAVAPCLNGANCTSVNNTYQCSCPYGFGGQRCEAQLDLCALINPCKNGDCYRGLPGKYLCFCHTGFTGADCETQISACSSNPCQSGSCVDYPDGFYCKCNSGFTGLDCSMLIDQCFTNPCRNGQCVTDLQSTTNSDGTLNITSAYRCLCDNGYSGLNCETTIDLCANNGGCINGGVCRPLSPNFAYCECPSGYGGVLCDSIINPCNTVTCYNGGTCNQTGINNFTCSCLDGFNGTYCEFQADLCNPSPCLNNGNCSTAANTKHSYYCSCPKNFGGVNCQFSQTCTENPCQNSAVCVKLFDGSPSCTCNPGFTGTYCEMVVDACKSNPCVNNATCYRYNYTQFLCACNPGFTGPTCALDVNECGASSNPCQNNGKCTNTYGSFACECPPGFTGNDCSVVAINPCLTNTCSFAGSSACLVNSSSSTGFTCVCKPNYTGPKCEQPIPPCLSNPCQYNSTCQNFADLSGYTCECTNQTFGQNCQFLANFCNLKSPCGPYGICNGTNETDYTCTCYPGFSGRNCEILNDGCLSSPCANQATCVSSIGYYTCLCPSGFNGTRCEFKTDNCATFPCYNGGTCVTTPNSTFCACPSGFTGNQCQFQSNCPVACQNGGVCNPQRDGCICPSGWTGTLCNLSTNPCASSPCINGGNCTVNNGSYVCSCRTGYTGLNCQSIASPCDSIPCVNGVCTAVNSIYKCLCFQPYTGVDCNTRLSLCNFINCGQGLCVPSPDSFNATCLCQAGFTGQYCNIRIQGLGCLSSPCKNGAQCVDLADGSYKCNCAVEFEGTNCEILKTCIPNYDYCGSMPCLNNGRCVTANCSFVCDCTGTNSFGPLCQFSSSQSAYSKVETINVLTASCTTEVNFNLEVKPCIVETWQQAYPQFACPSGFELIPNISDRCFYAQAVNATHFAKNVAEYDCSSRGGSLIALETLDKLTAVVNWLKTKSNNAAYYWTSTAIFRNSSGSAPSWLWASSITNKVVPLSYNNWGPSQSTNTNGDSIYLNGTDYSFYVGMSNMIYANISNQLAGFLCESSISGLQDNQLIISPVTSEGVYTSQGQTAIQISYRINVTLNNNTGVSQIRAPNSTLLRSVLLESCAKKLFIEPEDGQIFPLEKSYYIEICGNVVSFHLNSIKNALLNAWLVAHPEYIWCSTHRNCLKINIILVQTNKTDQWNQITRMNYVVTVNDVIVDPSQPNSAPTTEIIKANIEKLQKDYYQNYILCGVKVDSTTTYSYVSTDFVQNSGFPLALNKYVMANNNPLKNNVMTALRNAIITASPSLRQAQFNIVLSNQYSEVVVLTSFYNSINLTTRFDISPTSVLFPATLTSFQLIIDGTKVSYLTQALFDETQFYFSIQQQFYADSQLRQIGLNIYTPSFQPILSPSVSIFHLPLTSRLLLNDKSAFENALSNFISQNSIEFKNCKNCWNNSLTYGAKYIYTDLLVDSKGARYYDLWFLIIVQDSVTNTLSITQIAHENDFLSKLNLNRSNFETLINSIPILFKPGTNYNLVSSISNLRRFDDSIQLQLNQSVLNEDINPILNVLSLAVISNLPSTTPLIVEYWGQNEYLRNSNGQIQLYWQPIFYVRSTSIQANNGILRLTYDLQLNSVLLNIFFNTYNSTRRNLFVSLNSYSPTTDYLMKDLFFVPCFGLVSLDSYPFIVQLLNRRWLDLYNTTAGSTISSTVRIEQFGNLVIPYVNLRGSFSIIPYAVKAGGNTLLTPDVYQDPLFEILKSTLQGYCNLQDNINQVYRQDSLNFIQVLGVVKSDQAQSYLPSITNAYTAYFVSFPNNVRITEPSLIRSCEERIINALVVTRIYYQIFANTSQNFDAFNYQIKHTSFQIQPPMNLSGLVSRQLQITGRVDLITRAKITDVNLILEWLPQVAIEKELTASQNYLLTNALINFWTAVLNRINQQSNMVEVQLATSVNYFNYENMTRVTYIYYIISVNGKIQYSSELPKLTQEMENELRSKLNTAGFRLIDKSYARIRSIYFDLGSSVVVDFNLKLTADAIKKGWLDYLNSTLAMDVDSSDVRVWVLEQNLYYHDESPIIGLKYTIVVKDQDPYTYPIPDPFYSYFDKYFTSLKIVALSPLQARRIYVYSSLLNNTDQFKDEFEMKFRISDIWMKKNQLISLSQTTAPVYNTPYYSTKNGNFYSNFPNVPFYRATYTESINGVDPIPLFYETPNEKDFNGELLINSFNPYLMGFCFRNCFNYRQDGLLILSKYAKNPDDVLKAVKNSWIQENTIDSPLLNKLKIRIEFSNNENQFPIDVDTGLTMIIFNVMIENSFTLSNFDAMDLKEPQKDTYYTEFKNLFEEMVPEDFRICNQIPKHTITPKLITSKIPAVVKESTTAVINIANKSEHTPGLFWWGYLLIVMGVLLFITILILVIMVMRKPSISRRKLLSHKSQSTSSSDISTTNSRMSIKHFGKLSKTLQNNLPDSDLIIDSSNIAQELIYTDIRLHSNTSQENNTEPVFYSKVKTHSIKNKENKTLFYPGLAIQSIVPNPVYARKDDELVTNVYVTNNNPDVNTNPKYFTSSKEPVVIKNTSMQYKSWDDLTKEKSNSVDFFNKNYDS